MKLKRLILYSTNTQTINQKRTPLEFLGFPFLQKSTICSYFPQRNYKLCNTFSKTQQRQQVQINLTKFKEDTNKYDNIFFFSPSPSPKWENKSRIQLRRRLRTHKIQSECYDRQNSLEYAQGGQISYENINLRVGIRLRSSYTSWEKICHYFELKSGSSSSSGSKSLDCLIFLPSLAPVLPLLGFPLKKYLALLVKKANTNK